MVEQLVQTFAPPASDNTPDRALGHREHPCDRRPPNPSNDQGESFSLLDLSKRAWPTHADGF
jgi:hypothetical protein